MSDNREQVKAAVLAAISRFMAAHEGHQVRHDTHTDAGIPFVVVCETCGERVTLSTDLQPEKGTTH